MGHRLGGGGMADVYRAEVTGAEGFLRPVAIKRLHAAISADEAFCAMFIREARFLSQLHHTNIVSVLDFDWDEDGQLFLVMELVDGLDLSQLIKAGELPVSVAMHVMSAVLRALAYAHGRQIIHRDITPHNVLISWLGEVKLSDFGLAKAAMSSDASPMGTVRGKVQYLSPDQVHGLALDGRTDLFSAGVMLYEMVTGRLPFAEARLVPHTMAESIARMLTGTIVPPRDLRPEVPEAVDAVIMRLLERERERRFTSAQEVLATLPCPPRGADELAALLAERFPDRDVERDEPSLPEVASGPHIRGRRRSGRNARASKRARSSRRLRYIALLAGLFAFATIWRAERPRGDGGSGTARALDPRIEDGGGIGVDAATVLSDTDEQRSRAHRESGEPEEESDGSGGTRPTLRAPAAPVPTHAASLDVASEAVSRDAGRPGRYGARVSRPRQHAPAPRPDTEGMAERVEESSRDRETERSPADMPADSDPVDAAPAPVRAAPDAGPTRDNPPPSYSPYTRSEPWRKIEGKQ